MSGEQLRDAVEGAGLVDPDLVSATPRTVAAIFSFWTACPPAFVHVRPCLGSLS